LRFRRQIAPEAVYLWGAPLACKQILLNLLKNAVEACSKETEGEITVRVSREGAEIRVEVDDPGEGMTEDEKRRYFPVRGGPQGAGLTDGLGLAITRRLVEGQGGNLGVRDKPAPGACVWFTLPIPEEAPPVGTVPMAARGPLLLVVGDGGVFRLAAQDAAGRASNHVVTARDLRAAVEKCGGAAPDAVVLHLPPGVAERAAAARRVREVPGWAGVPVLGLLPLNARSAGAIEGCAELVPLPVTIQALADKLSRLAARPTGGTAALEGLRDDGR
jgi:hypothetical protein